ncbi:murein hydrolase activator EnvC family protein [Neofamilia massiliensis]|uniref:murein hydrolase activator EnvC family protein n=1 Tax=Neofamilia massiliensis TaxID=1673724 RepID=UPI0006BB71E9|nr:M23 family metallopeptidase [Neofamilia massiliensis]
MKYVKKLILFVLALVLFTSNTVFADAKLDSLKDKKKQMDEKVQNQESQIQGLNLQLDQVHQEIRDLDFKIMTSQDELDKINQQLLDLEESIAKNEENLAKAKEKLSSKEEDLNTRLREEYKNGSYVFLEILMDSSSISDMLKRLDVVTNILNQDRELLKFTNKQIAYIRDTENKLKEQKAEYKEKLAAEERKKAELEANNKKKLEFMAILQEDKVQAEAEYNEFVKLTQSLDAEIVKLEKELEEKRKAEEARRKAEEERRKAAGEVVRGSGQLSWPVPGYSSISSYYGYRVHPIFNTKKFHAGIDIPAPMGTPVKAAMSGIVIFSGWQGGYGNVVMISHGGDLVTVYAHNSSNKVSVGDYVDRGQTISLMGSTGFSTGSHSHFEVRINGSTVNPLAYL